MDTMNAEREKFLTALFSLIHALDGHGSPDENSLHLIVQAFYAPVDEYPLWTNRLNQTKAELTAACRHCANPCGRAQDYDMSRFNDAPASVRALREALLRKLREAPVDTDTLCRGLYLAGWGDETALREMLDA